MSIFDICRATDLSISLGSIKLPKSADSAPRRFLRLLRESKRISNLKISVYFLPKHHLHSPSELNCMLIPSDSIC